MKPPNHSPRRGLSSFLFLSFFFLINGTLRAQSPGNVSTDLELWLKADTDFATSQWDDQSGNNNHATQATSGNQPSSTSNAINFNTAISFDGNDNMDLTNNASTMGLNSSDYEIFMVMQTSDASNVMFLIGGEYERYELHLNGGIGLRFVTTALQYSDIGSTGDYGNGVARIMGATVDGGTSASSADGLFSSDTESSAQSSSTAAFQIGKRANNTYYFTGDIAEAVIYGDALTTTERSQVLSYMAIKYGITIDQTSATNYLASDGGTIWDGTANASYNTDITGIGRDDNSDLDQQKSHSVNSNAILTIANGDITSPSSFSADDSFLIWGSDNGATTFGSVNINNADGTTSNRMTRIWKVDETGTVGNVEISFDNSLATGTVSIVIDPSDNTFANNANRRVIEMTDNGSEYEVTVDFQDGDLFSFVNASASAIASKPVLINEIVTAPQQSWSSGNFYNSAPGGSATDGTDEWIELYIAQDGLDLSSWTIDLNDGTDVTGDLSATGAFDVSNYLSTSGGSITSTKVADYLILGSVDGGGAMDNTITINLKNGSGDIIDQVLVGTNTASGASSGTSDESIARIPGETDTNDNSVDFSLTKATLGETNTTTGTVKINEVVTDPQQDWSTNSFDGTITGAGTDGTDEWIELYIETSGINLTGWTIELTDGTDFSGDLTSSGAFQVSNYVGSGSFVNTSAGDYLVLGMPKSSEAMNNDVLIILKDASGTEIDRVQLGGAAGQAPSGNATGAVDESICRFTNATDTGADDNDFIQTIATLGANNSGTGTVLINEVVTDPQQDWETNGFSGIVGTASVTGSDEWIELYIADAGINLTGWTLSIEDSGLDVDDGIITTSGPFGDAVYFSSGSGSFLNTEAGDYYVLGNPTGEMNNDVLITLKDAYGTIIDQVEIGDDIAGDGAGDGAPDGDAAGGDASGISDESVARIANATDTDNDVNDFSHAEATLGAENFVNPLPSPGYGLDFDGTDDYVNLALVDLSAEDAMTIEAWVKPDDITTDRYYHITRQELDWLLAFQEYGTVLSFGLEANSSYSELDVSITAADYTDGNWHHIAAVYDGTNKYLYSDGVLIGTEAKTGNIEFSSTSNTIGSSQGTSQFFDGIIDEVRVWSDARTHDEILENMFTTLDGTETNLVAYYNFDQTTGTTLPDIQTLGLNDGTLTNMAGTEWTTTDWDAFTSNQSIVNPSSGSDVTSGATDELTINESAFLIDDGDFILLGHENSDFSEVTTDLPSPAGGTLVTTRYDRNWHLTKNDASGTTGGNVTFTFNLGATPNSDYTYYLLTRAGTSEAFSVASVLGVNPSGNNVVFTVDAANLTDGNYYTLGRSDAGVGNALDFDGTDDYVVISDSDDFNFGSAMTLEAWVNVASGNNQSSIICHVLNGSPFTGFTLDLGFNDSDGQLELFVSDGSSSQWLEETTTPLNDATWHHVAVTYDGSTVEFFIDGVAVDNVAGSSIAIGDAAAPLYLGTSQNLARDFDGQMDEVRIWNDIRTQEEIIDNMHLSLAGTESDLVAYYRFDQGIGDGNTSLPDLSGDLNTGTLTNFDNLGASTASSNYVTSDRTTFSDIAYIVNAGTDILTDASGELTISSTASDFLQDTNDQITWGNDGGAFSEVATDLPTGTLVSARMTKTWNIDKNDEVGTANGNMTFAFDVGTTPDPDYTYYLLTRSGTSSDFSVVEVIGSEPNGNSIEFTVDGAEVTDENYFTLGRSGSGPGNALDFDGSGDFIVVNNDTSLDLTTSDPFTMEFWMKAPTPSSGKTILSKMENTGAGLGYQIRLVNGGGIQFQFLDGDPGNFSSVAPSTSTANDVWQHVAISHNGTFTSGGFQVYFDGIEVSKSFSNTLTNAVSTSEKLVLGGRSETGSFAFDGLLDEIRVWSDVRTASEIEQNMHRTLDVASESNLVAYYKFDQGDADGTNTGVDLLTDHSGNDNSGDLTNFGLSSTSSNWVTSEAVAYDDQSAQALIGAGNALDFDGSNDYVQVSYDATLDVTNYVSMEAWVYPTAATWSSIAMKGSYGYGFALDGNGCSGANQLVFWDQSACASTIRSTNTYSLSQWQHVVVTTEDIGSQIEVYFYIDGIQDGPYYSSETALSNGGASSDLYIGRQGEFNGEYFTGQIDEVRVWNTARSSTEIQDNMYEELTGSETGLVAYYRFDEEAASGNTTLYDETTNSNDGTLTNMAPASDWVDASARDAFKTTGATNWNTATTWKGGAVPNATTADLNIGHDISLDTDVDVNDLNINSGVTLTLNSSQTLTVNGNLINNGTITGDGILLFNTGTPMITGGTLNNVEIAGDITSTLQGALTINGTLDLSNGLLALDEFNLTIGNSGSITRTDDTDYIQTLNQNSSGGYLFQNVANLAGSVNFPVGTSTYTPLSFVNLGSTTDMGVRVFDGTYTAGTFGTAHVSDLEIDRTWDVSGGTAGYNMTLTIQWNATEEDASFVRGSMFISRNTSDGYWRTISETIAASGIDPYTASVSGIDSFSQIGGGSGSSPLPVTWVNFSATKYDNEVMLEWQTASEINNERFEIERSTDGMEFQKIASLAGMGNSDELVAYVHRDRTPTEGTNYYRLKQVDFDGVYEYSEVAVVHMDEDFENQVRIYPNPSGDRFTLQLDKLSSEMTLKVVTLGGAIVIEQEFTQNQSSKQFEFGKQLEAGIYVIIMSADGQEFVRKIIKR